MGFEFFVFCFFLFRSPGAVCWRWGVCSNARGSATYLFDVRAFFVWFENGRHVRSTCRDEFESLSYRVALLCLLFLRASSILLPALDSMKALYSFFVLKLCLSFHNDFLKFMRFCGCWVCRFLSVILGGTMLKTCSPLRCALRLFQVDFAHVSSRPLHIFVSFPMIGVSFQYM